MMIEFEDSNWRVATVFSVTTGARTSWTVKAHRDDGDALLRELHVDLSDPQDNENFFAVMAALDLDHVAQGVLDNECDVFEVGRRLLGRHFYGVRRGALVVPSAMLPDDDIG